MKLNREFTLRETLLIIICAFIGIGIFYYYVVYKNIKESLNDYNTENVQAEIQLAEAKVAKKKQMESYIANHKNDVKGEMVEYNNLAAEISELGRIFKGVDEITISWSDPTLTDSTVRRRAAISFSVVGYPTVVDLIGDLANNKYRSLITDISITTVRDAVLADSTRVRVTLNMTFYERVYEDTNLQGLTIVN